MVLPPIKFRSFPGYIRKNPGYTGRKWDKNMLRLDTEFSDHSAFTQFQLAMLEVKKPRAKESLRSVGYGYKCSPTSWLDDSLMLLEVVGGLNQQLECLCLRARVLDADGRDTWRVSARGRRETRNNNLREMEGEREVPGANEEHGYEHGSEGVRGGEEEPKSETPLANATWEERERGATWHYQIRVIGVDVVVVEIESPVGYSTVQLWFKLQLPGAGSCTHRSAHNLQDLATNVAKTWPHSSPPDTYHPGLTPDRKEEGGLSFPERFGIRQQHPTLPHGTSTSDNILTLRINDVLWICALCYGDYGDYIN
ncbi:hypothetical protein C8R47DRAFT_1083052 [Mycena vitilis]|nr:hypothetical protein C8R47DRAFT_1083052 [Mycena vitilis]